MKINNSIKTLTTTAIAGTIVLFSITPVMADNHYFAPVDDGATYDEIQASNASKPSDSNFKLTPNCNPTLSPGKPGACDVSAFIKWVKDLINYLFIIAVPIATVFIVYGAFVMIKSGGNPGEFANGKKIVFSAVIGIIIIFTANLIVKTVVSALTGITK